MQKMDVSLLFLAFLLLAFGPRRIPPEGLLVNYGCPGNYQVFRTSSGFYVNVIASNGPWIEYDGHFISIPLYPLTIKYVTNKWCE